MPELKKFGDPDYGPYGFSFCNPAFSDQEPITNAQYIATIPPDDPWKPIIERGARKLDLRYPGWSIVQIKSKFNECRFYAQAPEWAYQNGEQYRQRAMFDQMVSNIERECDVAMERSKR
jgi:hypothetical protein